MAELSTRVQKSWQELAQASSRLDLRPKTRQIGRIESINQGIANVSGLDRVQSEEIVLCAQGIQGLVLDLSAQEVQVVFLDHWQGLQPGQEVTRSGHLAQIPAGESVLGRVIDPLGRPLDQGSPLSTDRLMEIEIEAPPIMHRDPVTVPLHTGIKAIDALIPIGRGQRELILGDRQTGKTALALDSILNQRDQGLICIYCAISQRSSGVAKAISSLRDYGAMDFTCVVVAEGEQPPGLQFLAPYAATALGEYFMRQGQDVLIVFDDLSKHALAYREISLLMRRPPGREAFPGDIFYIHSRLLERFARLKKEYGRGSMTALPITETEAQNISAFIPTNLISITDGQIYLNPDLYRKGVLPAVDVGQSVSRVGGRTQLPAFRAVAGDLKLAYSQFEELESFARFGTRLDQATQKTLAHGRRVREVLKQPQFSPLRAGTQIAILIAASRGLFSSLSLEQVAPAEQALVKSLPAEAAGLLAELEGGQDLSQEKEEALLAACQAIITGAVDAESGTA
jgi:F-type H+-transporting ATPase subunit alpha